MARTARKSRSCSLRASALKVTRRSTWSSASRSFRRASSADDVRVGLRAGSVSVVARCKGGRTQRALTARRNARASTLVEAPELLYQLGHPRHGQSPRRRHAPRDGIGAGPPADVGDGVSPFAGRGPRADGRRRAPRGAREGGVVLEQRRRRAAPAGRRGLGQVPRADGRPRRGRALGRGRGGLHRAWRCVLCRCARGSCASPTRGQNWPSLRPLFLAPATAQGARLLAQCHPAR